MRQLIGWTCACGIVWTLLAQSVFAADADVVATGPAQMLHFEPLYLRRNLTPIPDSDMPKELIFTFRLVPGYLLTGGFSHEQELGSVRKSDDVLDVARWLKLAEKYAEPLKAARAKQGLRVTPAETRLGTVFPLLFAPGSGRLNGRLLGEYHYLVGEDRGYRQLLYFDRACHLDIDYRRSTGRGRNRGQIDIPAAGFYLLGYAGDPETEIAQWQLQPSAGVYVVTQFHK